MKKTLIIALTFILPFLFLSGCSEKVPDGFVVEKIELIGATGAPYITGTLDGESTKLTAPVSELLFGMEYTGDKVSSNGMITNSTNDEGVMVMTGIDSLGFEVEYDGQIYTLIIKEGAVLNVEDVDGELKIAFGEDYCN